MPGDADGVRGTKTWMSLFKDHPYQAKQLYAYIFFFLKENPGKLEASEEKESSSWMPKAREGKGAEK